MPLSSSSRWILLGGAALLLLLLLAFRDASTTEIIAAAVEEDITGMDAARRELFLSAARLIPHEESLTLRVEARRGLHYVVKHMPQSDVDLHRVSAKTLAQITVCRTRKRLARWRDAVPWHIFVEFVLPYAALSEPRDESLSHDFVRKLERFVDSFVKPEATLSEAALVLNTMAYTITDPPIVFKSAPPNQVNSYSPFEVMQNKSASCTGESVFLVHALRCAGIPARVAGVPHWNRGPKMCPLGDASPTCGNHNWVEVYTEKGEWAFLDQNTGNQLNHAWFVPECTNELVDGDPMHSIYAATWNRDSEMRFPLVFDTDNHEVSAVPRTKCYQSGSSKPVSPVAVVN